MADRNLVPEKTLDVGKNYTPLNHVKDVVNYRPAHAERLRTTSTEGALCC